jgi:hypothetical protein
MLMVAGHAATSLPLAVALHSGTHSSALIALGAVGSAGFAVALSFVSSQAFRKPWPAHARAPVAAAAAAEPRRVAAGAL